MRKINNFAIDKKQERNSSIELLRIILMIMIVFHHFAVHGEFIWHSNEITIPHFWYNFIAMGGKIGVNIFILISGYFLIGEKTFNYKKIIQLYIKVLFYSILIYFLFCGFGLYNFSTRSLIKTFLPISFEEWGFVSTYFILYILHPYINKLLNSFDQRTYKIFLVISVVIWSILPTFTSKKCQGNDLLWYMTLYSIAGYERKFGINKKYNNTKQYFVIWIICLIMTYATSVIFMFMGVKWGFFAKYITYFYSQESIFVLLTSVSLFLLFKSLKVKQSVVINKIASATFGVYLIHDNYIIRNFLWTKLFKNYMYQTSNVLIIYSIIVVIFIYVVCTILELIQQKIIEKRCNYIINKYSDVLIEKIKKRICIYRSK